MSVIKKGKANELKKEVQQSPAYGQVLAKELLQQFDDLHSQDFFDDKKIEKLLIKQKEEQLTGEPYRRSRTPKGMVKFNPSGASSTVMDLYLKAKGFKEERTMHPYHKRWLRNSTAVHEAIQRDLLYSEKLVKNKSFRVARLRNGLPAWEENILRYVTLEHNGETFALKGMLDGILIHEETGRKVGFEFKTKSNSVGQVGHWLMRKPADYHVEQTVAYFLLTGVRDYIITYEGLAKPKWNAKGDEIKPDLRTFHVLVTDEMAEAVLDRWAYVTKCVRTNTPPEDKELGFFSGYGYLLDEDGNLLEEYKEDAKSGTR